MPSAASRRCAGTRRRSCCRSSRTTSGSSTPSCWSRPSAWACASARSRWTGSTTPTRSVDIVSTAADDLRGVWRLLVRRPKGLRRIRSNEVTADQLLRFAGVGVVSTLGYLFLFVAWRPLLGAFGANAVAMAIATLFNTAVHRELSAHRGRPGPPGPPPRRGRRPVPGEPRPHDAGACRGPVDRPVRPVRRAGGPHRGQRCSPPCSGSPCCGPGSSARAPRPGAGTPWRCPDDRPDVRPRRSGGVLDPPIAVGAAARHAPGGRADRSALAARPTPRLAGPLHPGQGERPGLGPTRPARVARRHRRPLPVGPRRQRLGQLLLLRRRPGGHQELEGHVLRILRLLQLHHGRQATRVLVADGDLGADLRPQLVERARTAGPRGCGHRRPGLPLRAPVVQRAGRAARRCRGRAHAGGRHDVPLQQPRRVAGPAAHGRDLCHHPRAREGPDQVARPRRRARSASVSSPR